MSNTEVKGDVVLMKGNEAIAHAAVRYGCDGYFGYPITPQSEVLETLEAMMPCETTGMVYAGASTGKAVLTSSSSPGISLMQEGISYIAAGELPALIVNVMRGGPGLGTIHPSQSDYFQATKGGGHGDYHMIVLAPKSVQEMADFVGLGFDLAFKYRTPAMILVDGMVGQMMEKVVLPPQRPRRTDEEVFEQCPWAATGDASKRGRNNIITTLELDSHVMEKNNERFQQTYRRIEENEVRFEEYMTEDAEWLVVAFGSMARISQAALNSAREAGVKVGLIRPITLWPFPYDRIREISSNIKGILVPEMNAGQMIEDVRLAVEGRVPVKHCGRMGGIIPSPSEVLSALNTLIEEKK